MRRFRSFRLQQRTRRARFREKQGARPRLEAHSRGFGDALSSIRAAGDGQLFPRSSCSAAASAPAPKAGDDRGPVRKSTDIRSFLRFILDGLQGFRHMPQAL